MCNTLSDRILHARRHAELTQKELASRVGVSHTTVSKLENGRAKYSRCMVTIATVCGVDPTWLETGRGEMLLSRYPEYLKVSGCRDVSNVFAKIPIVSWDTIDSVNSWIEHEKIKALCREFVPVFAQTKGQHYGLLVPDDSMEPEFLEGEVIVVNTELKIKNNQYILAKLEGESNTTFKQLVEIGDQQYLRPLNPRYPIITVDGNLQLFGVVVGKYKEYLYFGQ
ncbi:MAG: LexA family transcriptional regulator [Magnetococcales bacterium]|nr:LexA family transcriptional regulator [Magnetococcales bacterium]